MTAPKEAEVVYLDRARVVASLVRAIQADPEAMRIICELRDSGCSKEQFAEQFKHAWKAIEDAKEPRPSQPDPIECRTCRRDSENATECDDCGPENSFAERSPMEPRR